MTILLVEQNATRAVEFADRDLHPAHRPRRARTGTREEIRTMEDFETAYLGVVDGSCFSST